MLNSRHGFLAVLVVSGLAAVLAHGAVDSAPARTPQKTTLQAALDRALEDERHAMALYAAVMKKHGERRPFSNIINAERRHVAALLGQYKRLGLAPPDDAWAGRIFELPPTFAEACDLSVVAEVRNARLYEELRAGVTDEQVLTVFENLRRASVERHLPAFRRHGSGWATVDPAALSASQRAQRDRAAEAQNAMFATLLGELSRAMKEGGPTAAIEVCSTRAPAIAATVAGAQGVRIGRTSWKLRNPDNRPPLWAELLVDERPESVRFVADRSGRLGALTPIRVAAACIQCHGAPDQLAPGVRERLADLYPDDRATGFAEGDLRGWFWIEVPGDER